MSNFWQNYFSVFFNKAKVTISTVSATTQTISSSVVKTEVLTNTRDWNESICISFRVYYDIFIKGGQAVIATEVQVTSFYVKPNPKIVDFVFDNFFMLWLEFFLCCLWHILINIFWLYIVYYIKSDFYFTILYNTFHILHQRKNPS